MQTTIKFRIHEYSGRENGLMVIGPRSSVRSLIAELAAATDVISERADTEWPPQLQSFEVEGRDGAPYLVSFHLETVSARQPKSRLSPIVRKLATAVLFVLCLVGATTIVRIAASLF